MKNNLKIDYLGWVTLIIIVIATTAIYSQLSNLRSDIKLQSTVKVQVKDNEQLEKLSNQFMQQWGASGYCFYIYQPNSPVKTHKELASSSLTDLPLRLPIDDYRKISKSKIGVKATLEANINNSKSKLGIKKSESTKIKMSNYSKNRSLEHRANIGKTKTGIPRSDDTKRKISEAGKGRIPWNKGLKLCI
jgi:hypothetical protein